MVDDFEDRRKVPNRWRIAGWMLQISGLLVMWLGALPCLVQITWQVAVCSLPDMCVFLFFAFLACRVPRDIDVLGFIFFEFFLLNFMALPLSGLWQCSTRLELGAYSFWCILLCQWIWWFANFPDMSLVVFGLVICALPFGAFALTTTPSCNLVGPLLALGVFCTIWITQHLLCS